MIVNGLAIGIPVLLVFAGLGIVVVLLRRDDGRHTADALFTAAPEVHHAEYTPYDYTPAAPEDLVPGAGNPFTPVTTATCPSGHHALKVDSPAPEDVPGQLDRPARAHRISGPPGTLAGDQDPGTGSLPEGDTRAALWPEKETAGPGDLPPMSPLLAAAMQELEDAERWPHLAKDAGYSSGRPFADWERDSVVMPAIRGL